MPKISKYTFKNAVYEAFGKSGYTVTTVSMSMFGLQGDVIFRAEGRFGKQEAHVRYREKEGRCYIEAE